MLAHNSWASCMLHRCRGCVSRTCGCIYERVCFSWMRCGWEASRFSVPLPTPPVLAVSHISNWPTDPLSSVLFSLPVFAVSSLHLLALWAGGKAPGSPIVPGKRRYRPNRSRSENTDGRRLSGGFMENMAPRFPSFACRLIYHSSCFCSPKLSVLIPHSCLRLPVGVN